MGLFGGKSSPKTTQEEGEGNDGNAAEATPPTTTTEPTVELSDKKEPLLAKCEDSDAPMAVPNPPSGDLEGFHDDVKKPKEGEESEVQRVLKAKLNDYTEKGKVAVSNCFGLSPMVQCYLIVAGVSAAIIFGIVGSQRRKFKNVAMIGNSYFFVNDLPRLMESISGGRIFQDSCLHGSGSLLNILKTGNGMYYRWNTYEAMITDENFVNSDGDVVSIYDYGACSVPQLLLGQDSMLSYQNALGTFLSDGNNPCLQDLDYLEYQQSFNYSGNWDYVVLADQSKRMSFDESRQDALMALNYTYGPILKVINAKPILVQTHAFWSSNANMTGLDDVPTFTSKIMDGAVIYKDFLRKHGGKGGKVSPVGDAFLTVWEENHDLWEQLFLGDDIHPSPKGSYLYACVIYATIYGSMPKKGVAITGDVEGELFANARKLQTDYDYLYPTEDEAKYLYGVAKKVALKGFKPKSYKTIGLVVVEEDDDAVDDYQYYNNNNNNNNGGNDYQYNNNGGDNANDDYYYAAAGDDNQQQDDYQYQYQYQYANNNNNRQ